MASPVITTDFIADEAPRYTSRVNAEPISRAEFLAIKHDLTDRAEGSAPDAEFLTVGTHQGRMLLLIEDERHGNYVYDFEAKSMTPVDDRVHFE